MYYLCMCGCSARRSLATPELKQICSQSIGFCYLNTDGFKKRLQPLALEWLDQRFPNIIERVPNQSLVNTPRLSSFLISAIYSFLTYIHYKQTSSGKVENAQLRVGSPRRDPFFYPSPPLFGFWPILWEPLG